MKKYLLEAQISDLSNILKLFSRSLDRSKRLKSEEIERIIGHVKKIESQLSAIQYIVKTADADKLDRGLCPCCGGRVLSVEGGNVCMDCGEMSGCY